MKNLNIRFWKLDCQYQCFSGGLYGDVEFAESLLRPQGLLGLH